MSRRVICGIGQDFRGDDAAGLEALSRWERRHPPESWPPDLEVVALRAPAALPIHLDGAEDVLLIDCLRGVETAAEPAWVEDLRLLRAPGSMRPESHGLGVAETIRALERIPGQWPKRIALIGIPGARFDAGAPMRAETLRAVDIAVAWVERWIAHQPPDAPESPAVGNTQEP